MTAHRELYEKQVDANLALQRAALMAAYDAAVGMIGPAKPDGRRRENRKRRAKPAEVTPAVPGESEDTFS